LKDLEAAEKLVMKASQLVRGVKIDSRYHNDLATAVKKLYDLLSGSTEGFDRIIRVTKAEAEGHPLSPEMDKYHGLKGTTTGGKW